MHKHVIILLNVIALLLSGQVIAQPLTLEKCMEYAEQHNHELLVKGSKLAGPELENRSAVARLFPKVEGNAALDHYWQIPVQVFPGQLLGQPEGTFIPVRLGTPWTGSFGVEANLNLVDASVWQQIRLTALQKQLATSEWNSLKKALLKNVRMAYLTAQLSSTNVNSTEQRYHDYEESHRLISLQFDKGLIDKITLNQSKNILRNLDEVVSKSKSDLKLALLDLKFWMGYPMDDSISIGDADSLSFTDQVPEAFNPELLPDHEGYLLKQDVANQQYLSSRSAWYPKLSLRSGYSRLGFGQNIDFIGNSKWFSSGFVGLKLSIPLLDLDKMLYVPKKQKALIMTTELERSQYQEEQRKVWLKEEMLLKESLNSVRIQEENRALASENQQLSVKKLEKGIINVIELKQVQDELNQVQDKLNNAKLEYLKHYVELHHLQNN